MSNSLQNQFSKFQNPWLQPLRFNSLPSTMTNMRFVSPLEKKCAHTHTLLCSFQSFPLAKSHPKDFHEVEYFIVLAPTPLGMVSLRFIPLLTPPPHNVLSPPKFLDFLRLSWATGRIRQRGCFFLFVGKFEQAKHGNSDRVRFSHPELGAEKMATGLGPDKWSRLSPGAVLFVPRTMRWDLHGWGICFSFYELSKFRRVDCR